jgi:LPXTG-site transpeptidase (sortase) family protein
MVRAWPSAVGRAHLLPAVLGEVALIALLTVALAVSWRDGVPADGNVDVGSPPPSGIAAMQVSGNNLSGKPGFASQLPVVAAAPDPKALLPVGPTAAPVEVLIPLLDVHRPVEKVGFDQSGVLGLPLNAWNAGWFEYGPVPGAQGDAVIEGHAGYPGQPMMFGRLYTLRPGDRIIIVLADKSRRLFIVASKATVPTGASPPGLADPYGPPRLTLITCTGSFNKYSYSYSQRLLVYANYAGLA